MLFWLCHFEARDILMGLTGWGTGQGLGLRSGIRQGFLLRTLLSNKKQCFDNFLCHSNMAPSKCFVLRIRYHLDHRAHMVLKLERPIWKWLISAPSCSCREEWGRALPEVRRAVSERAWAGAGLPDTLAQGSTHPLLTYQAQLTPMASFWTGSP